MTYSITKNFQPLFILDFKGRSHRQIARDKLHFVMRNCSV